MSEAAEKAILAGGCFWGMQDLFRRQPGVLSTRVGYAGGDVPDPTTPNRQGNDVGTSYRSAILTLDDEQRRIAEETIAEVDASGLWPGKVVTEVTPAGPFWEAEPEHQDYLERYPNGYTCHFVRPAWVLPDGVTTPAG
jgi:peptide-methionine (S)-S-oxide reductase